MFKFYDPDFESVTYNTEAGSASQGVSQVVRDKTLHQMPGGIGAEGRAWALAHRQGSGVPCASLTGDLPSIALQLCPKSPSTHTEGPTSSARSWVTKDNGPLQLISQDGVLEDCGVGHKSTGR